MLLRDLLGEAAADAPDVDVRALAYDNREVVPDALFFCVPGFNRDGHDFAPDAVRRGAVALVVQRRLAIDVPQVRVADVRGAMAVAASAFYRHPTRELPVVGVTGTNGKTTTAFLVRSLLEAAGRPCGLLGTVKSVVGGQELESGRTTPEAIDLQPVFRAMLEAGDAACAMEVSSHALELRRADGVHFAVALFTNLTQDHLDFHPTMETYFQAKRRLFEGTPEPPGLRIANVDDAAGRRLAREFPDTVTFGLDGPADYRATDLRTGFAGSDFTLHTPTARCRSTPRFPAASTWSTCSGRSRRCGRSASTTTPSWRRSGTPGTSPGASSPCRRASPLRCSWTTHTRPTRSRTARGRARPRVRARRPGALRLRLWRRSGSGQAAAHGRHRRPLGG
jgi:UDP-N-acetylmuramoyl-L-alanyl-D-glutamate--2,6-diaminopimelate ligase